MIDKARLSNEAERLEARAPEAETRCAASIPVASPRPAPLREETSFRDLEEHLHFEVFLAELSSTFVAARADDIDDQIAAASQRVGEFLGLDRVGVVEALEAGALWRPLFWQGPRVSRDEGLGPISVDEVFPWLAESTRRRRPIVVSCLDEVPSEGANERGYCEMIGIRAFLMMPFSVGNSIVGSVFLDSASERTWSEDLIRWTRRLAEVFANALIRQRADRKISELKERLEAENVTLRREIELQHHHQRMVGESDSLRAVLRQAEQVAPTDSTVLILGETGTGKELLARTIHRLSPRRKRAMIKVNCAALPATLVEGELFGRERGAYTGAVTRQAGRFEAADSSTIFLDEVGELPPEAQAKLLRVLDNGDLERLGSSRTHRVDVRVIVATNRDLERAVADGTFRQDLYYRLAVFPITAPPLRERSGDVELLLRAFVRELRESMGKTFEQIPRRDLAALAHYPWPGNVRELRNVVERAMILSTPPRLHIEVPGSPPPSDLTFAAAQRQHLLKVLDRCGWKVSGPGGAAEVLDLRPTTLETKMKKLGIRRPPHKKSKPDGLASPAPVISGMT